MLQVLRLLFSPKERRSPRQRAGDWPGCHIADEFSDWILGLEELRGLRKWPDLSIDPKRKVLSAINKETSCRCFFVTVFCEAVGRQRRLEAGYWRKDGAEGEATTFVRRGACRNIIRIS